MKEPGCDYWTEVSTLDEEAVRLVLGNMVRNIINPSHHHTDRIQVITDIDDNDRAIELLNAAGFATDED
jgi:hypothetical protein